MEFVETLPNPLHAASGRCGKEGCGMEVQALLLCLGITPNYKAYPFLLTALELLQAEPDAILLVTKQLYPAVAGRHGTNWRVVERDLRTAVTLVWRRNPDLLRSMAGYPLVQKPTVSQFLAILLGQVRAQAEKVS